MEYNAQSESEDSGELAMTDGVSEEHVRGVVDAWIRRLEKLLADLEKERRSIDTQIEGVKRDLEDVAPFARSLGVELAAHPSSGAFVPGSRSTRLPPRRPEFANVSLQDAAERILAERPGAAIHANDIVTRIFDSSTAAHFRAAKSSVVPALSAGAKDGRWVRTAPNTFALLATEGEAAGVNGAPPQS
jgi:hypothetical protein